MASARLTWPPRRPRRQRVPPRPWDPQHPTDRRLQEDAARLLYVVIDEIVGDWVGLSVSPWPDADRLGRLRFRPGLGPLEVATRRGALVRFLRSGVRRRGADPRVGSVFAARVREGTAEDFLRTWTRRSDDLLAELQDLAVWLERPCDLSKEARDVAKLAYYGAVLPTLPERLETEWKIR